MLELEDIEILPESLPPPATDSAPTWMVVVAVAIIIVIAALIIRALASNAKKSPNNTSPLVHARAEFSRITESLTNPNIAESFPTIIHSWANEQLAQRASLPDIVVAEITTTRDLVAPHCYQPSTRWRNEIDPNSIITSLASALDVDMTDQQKGGQPNNA